jgi:hypothetical protein
MRASKSATNACPAPVIAPMRNQCMSGTRSRAEAQRIHVRHL